MSALLDSCKTGILSPSGEIIDLDSPCPTYRYEPLHSSQIRLLNISNYSQHPSRLSVINIALLTAPPYTTISYSWDNQVRDQDLAIDKNCIKIIKNLHQGLPHIIRNAKTDFLWIDAISINQEDDDEKAVQIPLMREIYTRCQECLVWLGASTYEAEVTLDAVPRLSNAIKTQNHSEVWENEGIAVGSKGVLDTALWKGFVDIFSRSWLKRVWTFQEAILPHTVTFLCGDRRARFEDLEPLAEPLLNHLTALQAAFPSSGLRESFLFSGFLRILRISKFKKPGRIFGKSLHTLRLLYFTRPWSVSNRLDKIYGVLGLTDPSLQDFLVVDYHKTGVELSKEVARWSVSLGEDLYVLNLASSNNKTTGLPSWVPNFTEMGSHWCIGVIWQRFRAGVHESYLPKMHTSEISGKLNLHAAGFLVDEVAEIISYVAKASKTEVEKIRNILSWEEDCLALSRSTLGGSADEIPDSYWLFMISGICDQHLTPSKEEYELLKEFLKCIAAEETFPPHLVGRYQDFSNQLRRLKQVVRLGSFFSTKNRQIGIGACHVQLGDQICILYGGSTPFIIRQNSEPEMTWQLISDSYVSNSMNGEVFKEVVHNIEQTFVLT
ncbi:hypothetical protein G7Y89_g5289 [Cudoniella acicularis]|uniref:Heterokaryon incompatibility domain-containing protein n=1 Tax=Cudoniella acicularis TaxID=354080 RepID=A0A8H4RMS3_9HELO|nr:hypothetical protein G7Y89_g5289 [Cudoniella acicularis]